MVNWPWLILAFYAGFGVALLVMGLCSAMGRDER